MEKRKIIKFGKNSFVVSLPKDWMQENKIKKGDEISVHNNGLNLIISPEFSQIKAEEEITIDGSDKDISLIKRLMYSAYINDYGTIIIKDFPVDFGSQIRKTAKNLFAVEIIEEKNKTTIKDILNVKDIMLPDIIRRMDNITRNMFTESIEDFGENSGEKIKKTDADVNRLAYLALKVVKMGMNDPSVMKILNLESSEVLHIWELVGRLENIADAIKRLSEISSRIKTSEKEKKEIVKFYELLKEDFISVMKSYYAKDKRLVYKILSEHLMKVEMLGKLNLKKDVSFSSIIEHMYIILESIRNIARSSLNTFLMEK